MTADTPREPVTEADQLREWLTWARERMQLAGVPEASIVDRIEARAAGLREAPELREALQEAVALPDVEQAKFERLGYRFDKWPPPEIPAERWTAENLAALAPEVRWQGIAFTLYMDICQLSSHAERALEEGAAPGAAPAEGRALDRVTLRDRVLALQPARKTLAYRQGYDDAVLAVLAMLRAPAEPDRIDVQRLARAMRTCGYWYWNDPVDEHAAKVAAAYSDLAEPATEG